MMVGGIGAFSLFLRINLVDILSDWLASCSQLDDSGRQACQRDGGPGSFVKIGAGHRSIPNRQGLPTAYQFETVGD